MSNLVLELRQGETMIVNGAPIRFRTKARIELTGRARFLFGKQIMPPDQADSPARRIYFALQSAYIGSIEERPRGLESARRLIAEFQEATTSALAREIFRGPWPRPRRTIAIRRSSSPAASSATRIPCSAAYLRRPARWITRRPARQQGAYKQMQTMSQARQAYEASSGFRNLREQEADVFRRVNGALRAAQKAGPIQRVRALADNRRLWLAMADLLRDPSNALPRELRASLISVGITIQREMDGDAPDFEFLIAVNENIAAGLGGNA